METTINLDGVSRELETIAQLGSKSSYASPITRSLFGLDNLNQPGQVPMFKDGHGYVFVTRPCLNLSEENIKFDRRLATLLTNEPNSINQYIRCMLDPKLQRFYGVKCPLVDEFQPFIPLFTNTVESLSGFRDIAPNLYSSPDGLYRESMSWIDGPSVDYSTYDIQFGLRNVIGNLATKLSAIWVHYQSFVFDDTIVPYPEFWLEYERDFDSRIWKINTDSTKSYVTQISSTIGMPINSPVGASGNYERAEPFNRANDQVSLSFRAHGYETFDNILVEEFNDTVSFRNMFMSDNYREAHMYLVPVEYHGLFKNLMYPRINPDTYALEWWTFQKRYASVLNNL